MQIYVLKNNQQLGPFEETRILEMLKNGELLTTDQAVRQGENQWQPLGNLFPNIAGLGINNAAQFSNQAAVISNRKGCRGTFGIAFLVLGILLFLGNIASLTISLVLPRPPVCEIADERMKEFNEAIAKQPTKENLQDVELKRTSMESSLRSCGEALEYYRRWRIIFAGAIFFGLIMALAGFFLRR